MALIAAWTAVAMVTAALLYRWRRSAWRSCGVVLCAGPMLAMTFLLTGPSASFVFARAAATGAGTVIVAVLAQPVVTKVLPRLERRADRWSAAILCAMLAVGFGAVGLMMWRVADDGLQLADVPVVRTGEEVLARWNRPPSTRIYGVLAVVRLGAADTATDSGTSQRDVLASFDCGSHSISSSRVTSWLPSSFTVTFADGTQGWAQGISTVGKAWNWPYSGRRQDECALHVGDPVIFWGDPGAMHPAGSDQRLPAINDVRVLAYGDLEKFRGKFVVAAQRTGRAALVIAALNGLLTMAMAIAGGLSYRRLNRDGTAGAPRITWSRA